MPKYIILITVVLLTGYSQTYSTCGVPWPTIDTRSDYVWYHV
jgi:hypothetical protein